MGEEKTRVILKHLGFSETEAQDFIDGCKRGLKEAKEGKVKPWSQVKEELGIVTPKPI